MFFNSFKFFIFFPIVFALYYAIPCKCIKIRNIVLLVSSYIFYMNWKPAYALVLLETTAITYFLALYIEKKHKLSTGVITLITLIIVLPLIIFKYYNFINSTLSGMLNMLGMSFHLQGLNIAIPIGISFFTFQTLGYVFDVYYKKEKAEHNFLDYALFTSFFPQIISGPISKSGSLLPQIKNNTKPFNAIKATTGMKLFLWGMFMKVVVADRLGIYVDFVYSSFMHQTGLTCLFASILYTIQIYSDFGGYSLMAIGVGKVLGFDIINNFNRPYFSVSITDFWRRWHISLSTWLKDYVYIPLGGNRCSKLRCYNNIFITFLVSGIWHGANWTFIIWGILHGIAQIVEKFWGIQKCTYGGWIKVFRIVITFIIVNFAWIFFRLPTLKGALQVINRVFTDTSFHIYWDKATLTYGLGSVIILFINDYFLEFYPNKILLFNNRHTYVRWSAYLAVLFAILLFGVLNTGNFIYASF